MRVLAIGSLPEFLRLKLTYGLRCDDRRRRIQGFVRATVRIRAWLDVEGGSSLLPLLVGIGERAITRSTTWYQGAALTRAFAECPHTETPSADEILEWLHRWARTRSASLADLASR